MLWDCFCSIWGVIFTLQGAAAVYAAMEAGYQMPGKCAAVNAVGELCWPHYVQSVIQRLCECVGVRLLSINDSSLPQQQLGLNPGWASILGHWQTA
jgi:hypothetical protein